MSIYRVSVTVDDYDFPNPQEAAEAMLKWLRVDNTDVYVEVENVETGETAEVVVVGANFLG